MEVPDVINSEPQRGLPALPGWPMVAGIGFTLVIALLSYGLFKLPGFNHIGQLACAIVIAVIYQQFWGYPEKIRVGI